MYDRSELRKETRKDATATVLGYPDVSVPCHITNYSESGLCIILSRSIPTRGAVRVEWDDHFLLGRVRRVSAQGLGFRVGLELLYCSRWKTVAAAKSGS
jgi:hypothetical protein